MKRTPLRRVGKKAHRNMAELRAVRGELLLRSLGRCETRGFSDLCTGVGVLAHHICRRSQGGGNNEQNLLWICTFCHDAIHAAPAEALRRGYLRPGGAA